MSLTRSFFLIWSAVSSPRSSCCWVPRLRGRGTGTKYELSRLCSTTRSVMPSLSKAKCLVGARYGELMIGLVMTRSVTDHPPHLSQLGNSDLIAEWVPVSHDAMI